MDGQLEARFAAPIAIPDPSTGFVLVRVGIRLMVGARHHIRWMRVQFETTGEPVISMLPQIVARPVTFTGRMSLNAAGTVSRRPSFDDVAEAAYQPFVRGHAPRPTAVSWDFLPGAPGASLSCDNLFFTTRARPGGLSLTATLMLAVGLTDSDSDYFELTDDLMVQ